MTALGRGLASGCVVALTWAAGCRQSARQPDARPDSAIEAVEIDDGATGYTILTGVPAGSAGQAIRRAAARAGARVVPWGQISRAPLAYLGGAILRDDYGLRSRLDQVTALISQRPGGHIAITWDGGVTDSDALLALAARRLVAERARPDGPHPARGGPSDPLDPDRTLGPR